MPNFAGKGAPSFGAGFKGLADMLASALRGGVVGTLGGAGDIEAALSSGNTHFLPRSEDFDKWLPPATTDKSWKPVEELGQFIPSSGAKVAAKALPAGAAAIPPAFIKKGAEEGSFDQIAAALKGAHDASGAKPLQVKGPTVSELQQEMKILHSELANAEGPWAAELTEQILALQKDIDKAKGKVPFVSLSELHKQEAVLQKQLFDAASNIDPNGMGGWDNISGLSDQLTDIQNQIKQFKANPPKAPLQLKSVAETGGSLHHGSKRNDLALVHGSHFENTEGIPGELTHPSLMIPAPKSLTATNFGENFLIADPRKFEPRTSPTVIKGSDFYTPRFQSAHFQGIKDPSSYGNPPMSTMLRLGAKERLADRNPYRWEKGGAFQEIGSKVDSPWAITTRQAPEFSSFKHFEEHPAGAARLDKFDPAVRPQDITDQYTQALRMMEKSGLAIHEGGRSYAPHDPRFIEHKNRFGQMHEPAFWEMHGTWKGQPVDASQARDIADALRANRKKLLEQSPSEYAEVKRYGHVPVTGENFTHALVNPELYRNQGEWLRGRGITPINYEDVLAGKSVLGTNEFSGGYVPSQELMGLISRLQAQTLRGRRR